MITVAVERNGRVYVYGENASCPLFNEVGMLYGYTSECVAIERHGRIYIYDEQHRRILDISK